MYMHNGMEQIKLFGNITVAQNVIHFALKLLIFFKTLKRRRIFGSNSLIYRKQIGSMAAQLGML
jgi:hypothetical protein